VTQTHRNLIPTEHLNPDPRCHLSGHLPTRLGGNLQAIRSLDPFFETFHGDGRYPGAISLAQARNMAAKTAVTLPAAYERARPTTPREIARSPRAREALNLLGTLISYGAVTNNQAATITNAPAWADPRSDVVAELFASRLISISSPYRGHSLGVSGDGSVAYQLGDPRVLRSLLDRLSYPEWLAATGGRDLHRTPVHLRHDILGTELALRAAASLRVGTVLGPRFSTFPDLTAGCRYPSTSHAGADLTIVRADGLRIAVEITASITQGFADKVHRWVRILNESPLESSGLVVVFLVAPPLSKGGHQVRRTTYDTIRRALELNAISSRYPITPRIAVASWREWFPEPTVASDRFARLAVDRPTGPGITWEECHLWEPNDFTLTTREPERLRSVVVNSALLSQTPWWIREQHRPAGLAADLLAEEVGHVDDVGPQRARSATRRTGAAQGVAAETTTPSRLVGPTDTSAASTSQRVVQPAGSHPWSSPEPEFGHRLRPIDDRRIT
jgi:hypothetical protein